MKVGIYSKHLHHFEDKDRLALTFAEFCLASGWEVEVFLHQAAVLTAASQRWGLQLDKIKTNPQLSEAFYTDASYFNRLLKWIKLSHFDLVYIAVEDTIPYLNAKRSWLYFDKVPQLEGKSFWTQQKLTHVHQIFTSSKMVKREVDKALTVKSTVIPPAIAIQDFMAHFEKETVILTTLDLSHHNNPASDVIISAFKQLIDIEVNDWWLICLNKGGYSEEELLRLRELSLGYPVEFFVGLAYEEVISWFHRAAFYWDATNYQIKDIFSLQPVPSSLVEAMASGCIPLVYETAVAEEIIKDKKNGYVWQDSDQLTKMTHNMIENLFKEAEVITNAQKTALGFSKERFFEAITNQFL